MSERCWRFSWVAVELRLQGTQFFGSRRESCIVLCETESEARAGERLLAKYAEWDRSHAIFPGPSFREIQIAFATYFRVIENLEKRTVRWPQFES